MISIEVVIKFIAAFFKVTLTDRGEGWATLKDDSTVVTVDYHPQGWAVEVEFEDGGISYQWSTLGDIALTLRESRSLDFEWAWGRWDACPWEGKPKHAVYMLPHLRLDELKVYY